MTEIAKITVKIVAIAAITTAIDIPTVGKSGLIPSAATVSTKKNKKDNGKTTNILLIRYMLSHPLILHPIEIYKTLDNLKSLLMRKKPSYFVVFVFYSHKTKTFKLHNLSCF